MHVRRVALWLTLSGVVVLSPLACDSPGAKVEAKPLAPDAMLATPDNEALLQAARRTRDAAVALVATCRLVSDVDESTFGVHDECTWGAPEEAAWTSAAVALRDLAASEGGTSRLRGPAAMFVDQARLFADWVQLVHELPKRGTLAHYQELALAWNAWRPTEPVASDPVRLRFPEWTGIDAGPDGTALRWDRCATGVCIVRKTSPR
ncbi:MAG: hypothetical protein JWM74_360 [Myxococcaceae bacterium]|nr:hypothetical protein [Myxococcaceae bacterium]